MPRPALIALLLGSVLALSACNPLLVGAGAAVGADAVAESQGGNLF